MLSQEGFLVPIAPCAPAPVMKRWEPAVPGTLCCLAAPLLSERLMRRSHRVWGAGPWQNTFKGWNKMSLWNNNCILYTPNKSVRMNLVLHNWILTSHNRAYFHLCCIINHLSYILGLVTPLWQTEWNSTFSLYVLWTCKNITLVPSYLGEIAASNKTLIKSSKTVTKCCKLPCCSNKSHFLYSRKIKLPHESLPVDLMLILQESDGQLCGKIQEPLFCVVYWAEQQTGLLLSTTFTNSDELERMNMRLP